MKYLAFLATSAFFVAQPLLAEERTVNLSVPGMYCASCPFIVQAAISDVNGVLSVTADSDQRTAVVVFEDSLATIEAITAASTNAGYEATLIDTES